jgi:hypothetical protein
MTRSADTDHDALAAGRRRRGTATKRKTTRPKAAAHPRAKSPKSAKAKSTRSAVRKTKAGTRHLTKLHAPRTAKGARIAVARHPRPHKLPKLKSSFNKHDPFIADYFARTTIIHDTPPPGHHKGSNIIKPP